MQRSIRAFLLVAVAAAVPFAALGQETRGAIFGHVTDSGSGAVVGAKVAVRNVDTNVSTDLKTNETGLYEASLLVAGNYEVLVDAAGFTKSLRKNLVLQVGTHLQIDFALQVGAVSETVTVAAGVDLVNTDTLSSGGVMESTSALELPNPGGNTMVLAKFTAGIQSFQSIADSTVRLHSTAAASNFSMFGNAVANEYSVDGMPNNGASPGSAWPSNGGQAGPGPGYMPAPELVESVRVETAGFDASIGHYGGASVSMMTRSGTNQWHGNLREDFQNNRWNALDFFTRQAFMTRIAQAEAAGNTATANSLIQQGGHQAGRVNQFAATLGGPVWIPKILNGRNKLFFFFGYAGFRVLTNSQSYNAVPTAAMRTGDFSALLAINPTLYQIYDPLSAAADDTRPGHIARTPFPGNIVPQSRIVNPMYNFYNKLLPLPNNINPNPAIEPNQDEISYANPATQRYDSYANRFDYNQSDANRFMVRWSWNKWASLSSMQYLSATNISSNGADRRNFGGGVDWVHTFGPRAVLDTVVAANDWYIWSVDPGFASLKPTDVGLPAYMNTLASASEVAPNVTWSGWSGVTQGSPQNTQHNRTLSAKTELSFMTARHTLKAGFDGRGQYNTYAAYGNNAGLFAFNATWTEHTDDGYLNAGTGNYGGSWASFMMGLPGTTSIDAQANQAAFNPYFGWYVQDNFRLTPRLSLNYGLRVEYEGGPTERYNRMLGAFDPTASLPITAAAQTAYALNPAVGIPASQFVVEGGNTYAGVGGTNRKLWDNVLEFEPRIAAAYQLDKKTVLRAGAGIFYDSFNVLEIANNTTLLNQTGFSNTTATTLSNDFGQTWQVGNPAAGVSPLTDPFPVLATGGREITAPGSGLGAMATVGKGYNFVPFDRPHTHMNRWRLDVQRMLDNATAITVGYAGSYTNHLPITQNLAAVPPQYWNYGSSVNNTVASQWNANVPNPFYLGNFSSLQSNNLSLYQYMASNSFFTSKTIAQSKLWAPYAQMNGLTQLSSLEKARTEELDVSLQHRFSKGFNLNVAYTRLYNYASDYFANPFDREPSWEPSNSGRPDRLVSTAVYEVPFGKGRRYFTHGPGSWLLGGYRFSVIQEYQPGALIQWPSNLYYTGSDVQNVCGGAESLAQNGWFNTANFVTGASLVAATGQARSFPNEINGYGSCRLMSMKNFNANAGRKFRLSERAGLEIRVDAYNLGNHSQFSNQPNTTPTSTQFGTMTSVNTAVTRAFIFLGRLTF